MASDPTTSPSGFRGIPGATAHHFASCVTASEAAAPAAVTSRDVQTGDDTILLAYPADRERDRSTVLHAVLARHITHLLSSGGSPLRACLRVRGHGASFACGGVVRVLAAGVRALVRSNGLDTFGLSCLIGLAPRRRRSPHSGAPSAPRRPHHWPTGARPWPRAGGGVPRRATAVASSHTSEGHRATGPTALAGARHVARRFDDAMRSSPVPPIARTESPYGFFTRSPRRPSIRFQPCSAPRNAGSPQRCDRSKPVC
jgi:hypothetical protein